MPRLLVLITLAAAFAAAPASANAASTVEHFGYFAARLTPSGGNHLAEVAARSNLNWVQVSDVDRNRPEVLDGCKQAGCIVSTGHEFFTGCDQAGSTTCRLHPDYRQRWMRLANAINSRFDKVGAFYLLDEPQWRGASPADIATAARTIRHTHPSTPVMMVEAGPKITESLQVPANVDWVGFDWYCRPFSDIRAKLATLERRTAAHQRLFLMPEAAPLPECGGRPGHATAAKLQEPLIACVNAPAQYAALAALEGRQDVVGSMRRAYHERRDAAAAQLDRDGVGYLRPEGAFYLWVDVRDRCGGDVKAWSLELLRRRHVAVAPGTTFGAGGEGWVRISLATETAELLEGLARLA